MGASVGPSLHKYCGALLCLAVLVGGGTVQGLWTTQVQQVLMLPIVFAGFAGFSIKAIGWLQTTILALAAVVLAIQFIPMANDFPDQLNLPASTGFFTQSPQRSLEAVLFVITVVPMFLVVQRMSSKQQERLLPFLFVGVAINLIFAIIHAANGDTFGPSLPLPYQTLGGLFANPNHFAALLYCMVPILAMLLINGRQNKVGFIAAMVLVLLFQVSIGSTAGMALAFLLGVVCFVLFASDRKRISLFALLAIIVLLALAVAFIAFRDTQFLDFGDRLTYAKYTLSAIEDTLPWGSGLGSFVEVYPTYEPARSIAAEYTNHAHNDYLELILEGGALMAVVLVLYVFKLLGASLTTQLQKAALIAIIALLVHSVVDYPLRTMAMAVLFAVLNGIVFSLPTPKTPK